MVIKIPMVITILQIERNNKLDSKIGRKYQNIIIPDDNNSRSLLIKISKVIRSMNKRFANNFDTNFLTKSIIIILPSNIKLPDKIVLILSSKPEGIPKTLKIGGISKTIHETIPHMNKRIFRNLDFLI